MAVCERDWDHFKHSDGELEFDDQLLPHELAAIMRRAKKRAGVWSGPEQESDAVRREKESAKQHVDYGADTSIPTVRQMRHQGAKMYGFKHNLAPKEAVAPITLTDEEFKPQWRMQRIR